MDPIQLVKQIVQLYMVAIVGIISLGVVYYISYTAKKLKSKVILCVKQCYMHWYIFGP